MDDRVIAALYVYDDPRGAYHGLPGVDLWGVDRDARNYDGPHPVVAHPPVLALVPPGRARGG